MSPFPIPRLFLSARPLMLPAVLLLLVSGCSSLRFAPGEAQRQNAWLHLRTSEAAAQTARSEGVSPTLQSLTGLAASQSSALAAYFGPPAAPPEANSTEAILANSSWELAERAAQEASLRPSGWDVADSVLGIGLAAAGLFGGAFGTRLAAFLQAAQAKARALREVVEGNERFKAGAPEQVPAFKAAHAEQCVTTRELVAALRAPQASRNGTPPAVP